MLSEVKELAKTTTVTVSEGVRSPKSKLSDFDESLDRVCELQQQNRSSIRNIEPQLRNVVQNSDESMELLKRNAAMLDDLQSALSQQITRRDLEPILIAINATNAQITRPAPRTTSPEASALLSALDIPDNLRRKCLPLCRCSCHKSLTASSPLWLQSSVGAFSLKYSLISYPGHMPCNSSLCHSRSDAFINIQYQLPLWLAARAFFCSLRWHSLTGTGASLWLRVPRILTNINFLSILLLNSDGIEGKLSALQILPTDIESISGSNLLTFALDCGLFHHLPSLLRFGADLTTPDLHGRSGAGCARIYLYYPDDTNVKARYSHILQRIAHSDEDEPRSASMIHDAVLGRITVPLEECISLQLDQINSLDDLGFAPLHLAILRGNVDAIHILLKFGADIDCTTRNFSNTSLYLACRGLFDYKLQEDFQESFVDGAMTLLDHGASVNIQDSKGYTPLHLSHRQPNVTLRLLSLGADPNARSKDDYMPFHGIIVYQKKLGKSHIMLKAYSKAGADFNAPFMGHTCLHLAGLTNPSLIPLLLEIGANVNSLTGTGDSILHMVLRGYESEVGMSMLVKLPLSLLQGLNPDLPNNSGRTALQLLERDVFPEKQLVREALLFLKLIVELRELNWEAGLFLEYKEEFELDGSHGRMKKWLFLQTLRLEHHGGDSDRVLDSLKRTWWHGWYTEDENIWDSDESQTNEEGNVERSMDCAGRQSDGLGQPENDGRREDSENEDDEFFDADQ